MLLNSGGASQFSGQNRLMQRPWLVQTRRSTAAAEFGLRRREEEDDRKGENEKKTWSCLFIRED